MRRRHVPFGRVLLLYSGTLAALVLAGLGLVSLSLYVGQRYMLYENAIYGDIANPRRIGMVGVRPVKVATVDGLTLNMWYKKAFPGCPTILYFHGNDGDVKARAFKMEPLLHAGWGALFAEYRGYAGNPGNPSEDGLYEDARAAVHHLATEGVPAEKLVLMGESLGSGVAVKMAEEYDPAGLVLVAPYTSISDVAQVMYWFVPAGLLIRDRFPSIARIGNLHSPVLIIHGEDDKTIPVSFARKLLAAAAEPKQGVFIPGGGHTDLFAKGAVDVIADFVDGKRACALDAERAE